MPYYDNALSSLARGGPGAVRYDGDSLINDEEHQYRINVAELLEHDTELIRFPDGMGKGTTIGAAEERINHVRAMMLKIADGLRTVGEAAQAAAPAIRTGTAADPEVQNALQQSSTAYESVEDVVPPDSDTPHFDDPGHSPAPGGGRHSAAPEEVSPEGVSPRTQVSSAASTPQEPVAGGPGQGAMGAAPAGQGPMGGPAGGPATAPSGAMTPPMGAGGGVPGAAPRRPRRDLEPGPGTHGGGTSLSDGGAVVAPMPLTNSSVPGGRVDPSQISGRTASTSPSAGLPPLKTGPAGSTGMMGGMGGMPLGGGGIGGGGGAARPGMPQPRRDRASERILTGEEARDKALVSHILRDDDPPAGEYVDSAELADLLPDERHPSTPHSTGYEPPAPMDVPSPAPVVMEVPPAAPPRTIGFREPYPGEPRDDELW